MALAFISLDAFAPATGSLAVIQGEAVSLYEDLVRAVVLVESNGNRYAFNKDEGAIGAFQVRQCRIDHYNAKTGLKMRLNDMYDYDKAKKVFLYFAQGKSYEVAAKSWNGAGSMTIAYWNKVKKQLNPISL